MVDNEEEATDLEVMRGNLSIAEGNSHLGGEMTTTHGPTTWTRPRSAGRHPQPFRLGARKKSGMLLTRAAPRATVH
jgi:hypothetical protein